MRELIEQCEVCSRDYYNCIEFRRIIRESLGVELDELIDKNIAPEDLNGTIRITEPCTIDLTNLND